MTKMEVFKYMVVASLGWGLGQLVFMGITGGVSVLSLSLWGYLLGQ